MQRKLEKRAAFCQRAQNRASVSIFVMGALSTGLVTIGHPMWVSMTVSVSGVVRMIVAMAQYEEEGLAATDAASALQALTSRWLALPVMQRVKISERDRMI